MTPADEILLTGTFMDTIDFGGGPLLATGMTFDGFVTKLDASGGYIWGLPLHGTSAEYGDSIAATTNGEIVMGGFDDDMDVDGTTLSTSGSTDIFLLSLTP